MSPLHPRSSLILRAAALALVAIAFHACGSSTTSVTSPTTGTRCGVTLQVGDPDVPAQGGTGRVTVSATRDCTWSASTDGGWLSLRGSASGQGDGAVEFSASANPDPVSRRGAVVLNAQRAEITQAAAPCAFSLGEASATVPQAGGQGQVAVVASSALCGWTASADVPWIQLRDTSGQGNGALRFEVAASPGTPRTGTVTIAGQRFAVLQVTAGDNCGSGLAPSSQSIPPGGGTGTIAVTIGPACPWTASSNVPWLTFSPTAGTGNATVAFSVAASEGGARTGTGVIAGNLFTVTQAASEGCTYEVQPLTASIAADGGNVAVTVATGAACPWSATSDVPWLTIPGPAAGSGRATITYTVAATTGPARTGTATLAGQRITISQTPPPPPPAPTCSFTITPESATVPAAGGSGTVAVSAASDCQWTSSSNASWLAITSGASGSGNGEVRYTAAPTTGPERTATLTIAGRTFTLTQRQGCAFTLSPGSASVAQGGGDGTFTVQTGEGCQWTAASGVPWISITSGASGAGTGNVRFTAAANTGAPRVGTIAAAGQTFTVNQAGACSYSLTPSSHDASAAGGPIPVAVTATANCPWTATSGVPWITVSAGGAGTGSGTVALQVQGNTGPERTGIVTIAGESFTVRQASGCSFSLSAPSQSISRAGGQGTVNVTASNQACTWTAVSQVPWITVTSGAGGTGNGSVDFTVGPHPNGPPRTGTILIGGVIFTVSQG